MLLSKGSVYAIRTALYLAVNEPENNVPVQEIAVALNIPFHFLGKITQILSKNHIIKSVRGRNGGITLGRPPQAITLYQIVEAMEGPHVFDDCILGLPGCGEKTPCPLHEEWGIVRDEFKAYFASTNLDELAHRVKELNLRIADGEVTQNLGETRG